MRTILSICLAIPATTLSFAAPTPPVGIPNYYPLKVGMKWHYKGHRLEPEKKDCMVVIKVEEEETINGVRMAHLLLDEDGYTFCNQHLVANAHGVFRHRFNGLKVSPPMCLLQFPIREGAKWDDTNTSGTRKGAYTSQIGFADVEVPAGKYKAVTVKVEGEYEGVKYRSTCWMVEGVGIVKEDIEHGVYKMSMELEKVEMPK